MINGNISNNYSFEYYDEENDSKSSLLDHQQQYFNNGSCSEFLLGGSVLSSTWFQGTIYTLYGTIFVVALVGNGLVCYVVNSAPRMKTVTNYFIVNLATGDILITFFCVPTSFVSTLILQYWPFGETLCPVVNYSQVKKKNKFY